MIAYRAEERGAIASMDNAALVSTRRPKVNNKRRHLRRPKR
jgi:hypothetical protein